MTLLELLKHENTDITGDAIDLVHDLLDPDMLAESMEEACQLLDSLVENSFLELLTDNLSRLNEDEEAEAEAVHNIFGVVENLIGAALLCILLSCAAAILIVDIATP